MLSVRFEYLHPWPNQVGFYMARAKGLYEQYGIDPEFFSGDESRGDTAAVLARGEYDVALVRLNQLYFHQQGEASLIAVGVMNQCQVGGIITNKSTGITRFRDLEGRKVCVPLHVDRLLTELRQAVEADGGDFSKLNIVDPGNWEPDMRAIERGDFEAVINVPWWEAFQGSQPFDQVVTLAFDDVDAVKHPSYYVAVRREMLDRQPNLVRNFMRATAEGYRMVKEDPEEAVRVMQTPMRYIAPYVLRAAINATMPTWFDDNGYWGTADLGLIREYTKWMYKAGHLSVPLDDALASLDGGCITNAFLPHCDEEPPAPLGLHFVG